MLKGPAGSLLQLMVRMKNGVEVRVALKRTVIEQNADPLNWLMTSADVSVPPDDVKSAIIK